MPSRVTYQDVAERMGVSTASVSRALSHRDGVAPELAEHIRTVAAEMGYRSNRAARALRRRKAEAIGLVISDVENPFFAAVARVVERVAAEHGHSVLLCNTDENLDAEHRYLDLLAGENVAGVVIAPSRERLGALELLLEERIPTVLLDRCVEDDPFDAVLIDHRAGAELLMDHLIVEHGHSGIAMVMGTAEATPSRERLEGAQRSADKHGARLSVLEGGMREGVGVTGTFELGERLVTRLLDGHDSVSAVFAANGLLSLGALNALSRHGVEVPADIALMGFDDQPFFGMVNPPLSVVAQPTEELGRVVAERLFTRIAEPDAPSERTRLPAELRARRSCGCD